MAKYDRQQEDVSNIVHLEHVNVWVPDQRLATLFYVTGLGLTRDPFLMTSTDNMWVNVGRSQFHLMTGPAQVLRGITGLVIPDRAFLLKRLASVKGELAGTKFRVEEHEHFLAVTCPWGNRLRIHEPAPEYGRNKLAMPYVTFDVPVGTARGIADFYRGIFGVKTGVTSLEDAPAADVSIGRDQKLRFRETDAPPPPYDNHHIQVYLADFSGPHGRLDARGLITQESNPWQYRFQDIVDPADGRVLFTVEHEVRSLTHPLYGRPLVNRNPYQTNREFVNGYETRAPDLSWAESADW
jgi:catechol 2,3-dioxygenase-like lactoylglutathione lyase family enzyme